MIIELYERAIRAGTLDWKLLGAGAVEFLLCFTNADMRNALRNAVRDFLVFDFKFETDGSKIINYQNT